MDLSIRNWEASYQEMRICPSTKMCLNLWIMDNWYRMVNTPGLMYFLSQTKRLRFNKYIRDNYWWFIRKLMIYPAKCGYTINILLSDIMEQNNKMIFGFVWQWWIYPGIYLQFMFFVWGKKMGNDVVQLNPAFPGASSPAEADTATSADKALWNTVSVWADGIRLGYRYLD